MSEIHCHNCGGFISGDLRDVAYRLPADTVLLAAPHSGLCACEHPVLYEPSPEAAAPPAMPGAGSGS